MAIINRIRESVILNLKNIPGWSTRRKIIVIECDDWGSIRMPSRDAFNKMRSRGLNVDNNRFSRYDTLETSEDLEMLFTVLRSVRDANGRPAVMTAVTSTANPDFSRIRESGFLHYYNESFTATLRSYYQNDNVLKTWIGGMTDGIFVPELHGREHLAVNAWMKCLKEGDEQLLFAFNNGFVSLDVKGLPAILSEFRPGFYFNSIEEMPFLVNAVRDSVGVFKHAFGRAPSAFVPPNGLFHPELDREVAAQGIKYLFVSNIMPYPTGGGRIANRWLVTGMKGPGGLRYYTRNCAFEPGDEKYGGTGLTLRQIDAAFRWGKPASISTHRVNFVGGLSEKNREKGLTELKALLKSIVRQWPEAEFMSAVEAYDHVVAGN